MVRGEGVNNILLIEQEQEQEQQELLWLDEKGDSTSELYGSSLHEKSRQFDRFLEFKDVVGYDYENEESDYLIERSYEEDEIDVQTAMNMTFVDCFGLVSNWSNHVFVNVSFSNCVFHTLNPDSSRLSFQSPSQLGLQYHTVVVHFFNCTFENLSRHAIHIFSRWVNLTAYVTFDRCLFRNNRQTPVFFGIRPDQSNRYTVFVVPSQSDY